ncbi:MAG: hypothetical protein JSS81_09200 [Acidobacteria bacterium]|nr:hypothetical protein [Acidobacteriota bacterium]
MSDLTLAKINTPEMRNLMRGIPFTIEDLDANDEGFLSARQITELKAKTDLYTALGVLAAFMSFCLATILFYLANDVATMTALKIISLIVFAVSMFAVTLGLKLGRRVRRGSGVKTVEGKAELSLSVSTTGEAPVYSLRIGGAEFLLTKEAYLSFAPGEYRVYYYQLIGKVLLSAEKTG